MIPQLSLFALAGPKIQPQEQSDAEKSGSSSSSPSSSSCSSLSEELTTDFAHAFHLLPRATFVDSLEIITNVSMGLTSTIGILTTDSAGTTLSLPGSIVPSDVMTSLSGSIIPTTLLTDTDSPPEPDTVASTTTTTTTTTASVVSQEPPGNVPPISPLTSAASAGTQASQPLPLSWTDSSGVLITTTAISLQPNKDAAAGMTGLISVKIVVLFVIVGILIQI